MSPEMIFIGWDVGGWHCDNNTKSRDALVLLDERRNLIGRPFRGNLRQCIENAANTTDWLRALFSLCGAALPDAARFTLAIDTPLGFPADFVRLITRGGPVEGIGEVSGRNPYLFRMTERYLLERGITPLSPIKDMIGSQSTKGMHVLAKFAPRALSCGVWSDGEGLTVIEAYPSPCRLSKHMAALKEPFAQFSFGRQDKEDALVCALTASLFAIDPTRLSPPSGAVPEGEGWIWVPKDALAATC